MSSVYCAIIRCRASEAENVDFIGSVPLIYIGFSCLDPAVLTIYVSLPITLEVFAFLMGRVFISALVKGKGHNRHLNAELCKRRVHEMDIFVKEYGEVEGLDGSGNDEERLNTFFNGIKYTDRKKMLRWHVALEEVSKNTSLSLDDAFAKCNSFDPRSTLCQEFLLPEEREGDDGDGSV